MRKEDCLEIKGQAFKSFLIAFEKLYGKAAIEKLKQALDPDVAAAINARTLIPSGWYSMAWYCSMHRAAKVAIPNDPGLAKTMGSATTNLDMAGIYSTFVRMFSSQRLLKFASAIFGVYARGASVRAEAGGPKRMSMHYHFNEPPFVELYGELLGAVEALLLIGGEKNPVAVWSSGGKEGDTDSVMEVSW
jgi:hypothetical protein